MTQRRSSARQTQEMERAGRNEKSLRGFWVRVNGQTEMKQSSQSNMMRFKREEYNRERIFLWVKIVVLHWEVSRSQIRTVQSAEAEIRNWVSWTYTNPLIQSVCPSNSNITYSVSQLHPLILNPSFLPVHVINHPAFSKHTKFLTVVFLPSGLPPNCFTSVNSPLTSLKFQNLNTESSLTDTTIFLKNETQGSRPSRTFNVESLLWCQQLRLPSAEEDTRWDLLQATDSTRESNAVEIVWVGGSAVSGNLSQKFFIFSISPSISSHIPCINSTYFLSLIGFFFIYPLICLTVKSQFFRCSVISTFWRICSWYLLALTCAPRHISSILATYFSSLWMASLKVLMQVSRSCSQRWWMVVGILREGVSERQRREFSKVGRQVGAGFVKLFDSVLLPCDLRWQDQQINCYCCSSARRKGSSVGWLQILHQSLRHRCQRMCSNIMIRFLKQLCGCEITEGWKWLGGRSNQMGMGEWMDRVSCFYKNGVGQQHL